MVLAADDVGDPHIDVIHDVHEMKNPAAIGPANGHVGIRLRAGHVDFHAAADEVVHRHGFPLEAKPPRPAVFVNAVCSAQFLETSFV